MTPKEREQLQASREHFSETFEALNKAFIHHSIAYSDLKAKIQEIEDSDPTQPALLNVKE